MSKPHESVQLRESALPVVSGIFLAAIALFTLTATVGRNLDIQGTRGAYELTGLAAIWLYFVGAAYATQRGGHIGSHGDGLGYTRKGILFKIHRVFVAIVEFATLTAFLLAAYTMITWQMERELLSVTLRLPSYLWPLGLLVGCLLAGLGTISRLRVSLSSGRPINNEP